MLRKRNKLAPHALNVYLIRRILRIRRIIHEVSRLPSEYRRGRGAIIE